VNAAPRGRRFENGFRCDAENGNRDGRAPQQSPSRAAKGGLGIGRKFFLHQGRFLKRFLLVVQNPNRKQNENSEKFTGRQYC
jgi:hypothetical protein